MGTSEIKDAFNSIDTAIQCTRVLMWLERDSDGKEWQRMAFHGINEDGSPFEVLAEPHSPNEDTTVVARRVAKDFILSKPVKENE